uniref:Uncharacterized protein n=1 Tax=Anguilla anguilla TaxID=7936 RepID=A0A0E9QVD4_ANGAN
MGELVFTSQVADPFIQVNSQHEQYKKSKYNQSVSVK